MHVQTWHVKTCQNRFDNAFINMSVWFKHKLHVKSQGFSVKTSVIFVTQSFHDFIIDLFYDAFCPF